MAQYEDDEDESAVLRPQARRRRGGRRRSGTAISDDPPIMPTRSSSEPPSRGARAGGGFSLARWLMIAALLYAAYQARDVLVLLVVALLFAHAVAPVVDRLASLRVLGRPFPRSLAAGLVLLAALGGLGWFVSTLVPVLVTDFTQLLTRTPAYLQTTQSFLQQLRVRGEGLSLPDSWWSALDTTISDEVGKLASSFGRGAFSLLSHVVQILGLVIIPILSFHLLRDGPRFTAWILSLVPARRRLSVQGVVHDIDRALAAYVRGQTLVCVTMGVSVGVALALCGFPYAPLLGTFAGLAEAVPYIGALAMEVLLAIIGLSVSPTYALLGPGVYFVLNQALGMLVTPQLMGRRLDLHPMAVILAVFIGGSVAGFTGMLLALPGAAIVNVLLQRWRVTADQAR